MLVTEDDWRERARRLADTIAADGVLRDRAWRAALEATPRHVFVPRFYTQRPGGEPVETTSADEGWLDAVYRNEALVTSLGMTPDGKRLPLSSSSKPGLMIRMLEALNVADGQRVLEIGAGTGYNAALLTRRLGDDRVFSVDIGAGLVAEARERLGSLQLAPTLVAADGAAGLPGHAPYDRIIATCSVSEVPPAWGEQLANDGLLLVDVKRGTHAGNLVLLRRHADRLEGRFLPAWAGFMPIRTAHAPPEPLSGSGDIEIDTGVRSMTIIDPLPWNGLVPWFLAHARLPSGPTFGYRGAGRDGPEWATFTCGDGSWSAVRLAVGEHGGREVRQGGPTPLWDEVERAHREWRTLGQPNWDRFGLTVSSDGPHRVWLDQPLGEHGWDLPPVARGRGAP